MAHEIFPRYNCALKPEFIMLIFWRCRDSPFPHYLCAPRALKKKDMQGALNKFTLLVLPHSLRKSVRDLIILLSLKSDLRYREIHLYRCNFYSGPNERLSCPTLNRFFLYFFTRK